MSIALLTASTKMRNGVYCCVMHKTKHIVDILCTGDYSFQQGDRFMYAKIFFPNLYSHFPFFEKLYYYYERKLRNIYKNTCAFIFLWWNQKQPPEVFYKKAVLKNFAIFTRKHLCWSFFLIKLQAFRPDSKRHSNKDVFLWIFQNF